MRASASLTLTLNMVAIPVKLYLAASDESIGFNMLTPAGNRVKQKWVDAQTGEDVLPKDCGKGYEFSKGQYVRFTEDELRALELKTSKDVAIQEFVEPELINYVMIEKTYFLGPDKGGDKAYALLAHTLRSSKLVGIAQWTDKGKQKLVAIRPYGKGLAIQVLFYANEIRDFDEIEVAPVQFSKEEKALASKLVQHYTRPDGFDLSSYSDGYQDKVKAAVEQKIQKRDISVVVDTQGSATSTTLDLLAALKDSLEKPAKKGHK